MTFDNFKKVFFPSHYAVNEQKDDEEDKKAFAFRQEIENNKQN